MEAFLLCYLCYLLRGEYCSEKCEIGGGPDIHICVLSLVALKIMRICDVKLRASCGRNCNVHPNVGIQQAEAFCFKVEMLGLCFFPT